MCAIAFFAALAAAGLPSQLFFLVFAPSQGVSLQFTEVYSLQGAAVQKQSHSSLAFGHDGSFGHDGAVIQRAPSSAPKYSNVSIALPEPPQLSRDSSAAATPKLFAHTVGPTNLRGDAQKPPSSLRLDAQKRMSACDMIFNTVPSAFKPSSSVYGSQQVGSDMASVHSAFPAVSEDGNADWYSDKASDTSKLLDAFDGVLLCLLHSIRTVGASLESALVSQRSYRHDKYAVPECSKDTVT